MQTVQDRYVAARERLEAAFALSAAPEALLKVDIAVMPGTTSLTKIVIRRTLEEANRGEQGGFAQPL